jgi:lysophospholipase L1-like esterase
MATTYRPPVVGEVDAAALAAVAAEAVTRAAADLLKQDASTAATDAEVASAVAAINAAVATDAELAAAVALDRARLDAVESSDALKAPLASPTFTGSPTAPTPTGGDSSTKIATTAFVAAAAPTVADAALATKGITRLSAAPAVAATPIAVGDNDQRILNISQAGRTKLFDSRLSLYNATPANLRKLRAAIAKARSTSFARLNFYGDSTIHGSGGDSPYHTHSAVSRLRALFDAKYGAAGTGVEIPFTPAIGGDTRWTFAGSWGAASFGIMGSTTALASNGAGNTVAFAAPSCDSFTIWYLRASPGGTFNINVDGGADTPVNSNGAFAYQAVTIAAGALGAHTLNIKAPASGSLYLCGVEATIGTVGVRVSRLGVPGRTSAEIGAAAATSATGWNSLQFDLMPPDVSVLAMGINDWLTQVALATYKAQVQAAITKALTTGACILEVPTPPGAASPPAIPWTSYVTQLYDLADTNDIPLIDMTHRWSDWTTSNAAPMAYYGGDYLHPSGRGYWDITAAFRNVILEP